MYFKYYFFNSIVWLFALLFHQRRPILVIHLSNNYTRCIKSQKIVSNFWSYCILNFHILPISFCTMVEIFPFFFTRIVLIVLQLLLLSCHVGESSYDVPYIFIILCVLCLGCSVMAIIMHFFSSPCVLQVYVLIYFYIYFFGFLPLSILIGYFLRCILAIFQLIPCQFLHFQFFINGFSFFAHCAFCSLFFLSCIFPIWLALFLFMYPVIVLG